MMQSLFVLTFLFVLCQSTCLTRLFKVLTWENRMPPSGFRKLLTLIHLFVILSFILQPVDPMAATAATLAAQDARPREQEESPAEPTLEPIAEFPAEPDFPPVEPDLPPAPSIIGPLLPENVVEELEPPIEAAEPVAMEVAPPQEMELAPQP